MSDKGIGRNGMWIHIIQHSNFEQFQHTQFSTQFCIVYCIYPIVNLLGTKEWKCAKNYNKWHSKFFFLKLQSAFMKFQTITVSECCLIKLLLHNLFKKYIYILALEMPSPGNQHCASCIGSLSFSIKQQSDFNWFGNHAAISVCKFRLPGSSVTSISWGLSHEACHMKGLNSKTVLTKQR